MENIIDPTTRELSSYGIKKERHIFSLIIYSLCTIQDPSLSDEGTKNGFHYHVNKVLSNNVELEPELTRNAACFLKYIQENPMEVKKALKDPKMNVSCFSSIIEDLRIYEIELGDTANNGVNVLSLDVKDFVDRIYDVKNKCLKKEKFVGERDQLKKDLTNTLEKEQFLQRVYSTSKEDSGMSK